MTFCKDLSNKFDISNESRKVQNSGIIVFKKSIKQSVSFIAAVVQGTTCFEEILDGNVFKTSAYFVMKFMKNWEIRNAFLANCFFLPLIKFFLTKPIFTFAVLNRYMV